MTNSTLRWLAPVAIILLAVTIPVGITVLLGLFGIDDPGLSFLIGLACGSPGGLLAVIAWDHYDEKIKGW